MIVNVTANSNDIRPFGGQFWAGNVLARLR